MASKRKTPSTTTIATKPQKKSTPPVDLACNIVKHEMVVDTLSNLQKQCNATAKGSAKVANLVAETDDGKGPALKVQLVFVKPTQVLIHVSGTRDLDRVILMVGKERRSFGEIFRSEELAHTLTQQMLDGFARSFFSSLKVKGPQLLPRAEPGAVDPIRIPAVGGVKIYEYEGIFDFRVVDGWHGVSIGVFAT